MGTAETTTISFLILVTFNLTLGLEVKPSSLFSRHDEVCLSQSKQPYFDIELVIGKPWRVYYTWNVNMGDKCLDMIAKNATLSIANRIYNDMHDYLETQPVWEAATLYMTMGSAKHELLLFADQGAAGSFLAVPNVIKDANITPMRKGVPLLKFFIKLLHEGKYLLMMDCYMGVASLMSRERPPYMSEVSSVAKSLNLGPGSLACLSEKRKDEQFTLI